MNLNILLNIDYVGIATSLWEKIFSNATVWTALGALCAFGCLIGVLFALKQLRFSAWVNAQEIVTDPEFTGARTRIQDRFESEEYMPTGNDKEDAKMVCRRWDQLCWLVFEGFISKRKVLRYWCVSMGKCFIIVEERWYTISREREIAKGHFDKWDAFFQLGSEAAKIVKSLKLQK